MEGLLLGLKMAQSTGVQQLAVAGEARIVEQVCCDSCLLEQAKPDW